MCPESLYIIVKNFKILKLKISGIINDVNTSFKDWDVQKTLLELPYSTNITMQTCSNTIKCEPFRT